MEPIITRANTFTTKSFDGSILNGLALMTPIVFSNPSD